VTTATRRDATSDGTNDGRGRPAHEKAHTGTPSGGRMALLDTALRVYLMYVVGAVAAFALVALLGQVLPDGVALFGGFLIAVLLALGGVGWYGLRR
jgi:hypothetical protein